MSDPYYPKSNGMAERAVQTGKKMLKKSIDENSDLNAALMEYRATPIDEHIDAPCQLLFGRRIRTFVPVIGKLLKTTYSDEIKSKLVERQNIQKSYYDRRTHSLPELKEGSSAYMYNRKNKRWEPVMVNKRLGERSYNVSTETGGIYNRNRIDLKMNKSEFPTMTTPNLDYNSTNLVQENEIVNNPIVDVPVMNDHLDGDVMLNQESSNVGVPQNETIVRRSTRRKVQNKNIYNEQFVTDGQFFSD